MRKCDLYTGAGRIRKALETLEQTRDEASDQWHDAVSERFFEHHLEPLVPEVKMTLDAIARLHLLLDEMQRDCES
jgi:hypothetical protein